MISKFFKPLFITLFLTVFSFGLKAQEQYEYATVKYYPASLVYKGIYISISGQEMEKIEINKGDVKDIFQDETPVVNYVSAMTKKGWRVINTFSVSANSGSGGSVTFVLERKKQ